GVTVRRFLLRTYSGIIPTHMVKLFELIKNVVSCLEKNMVLFEKKTRQQVEEKRGTFSLDPLAAIHDYEATSSLLNLQCRPQELHQGHSKSRKAFYCSSTGHCNMNVVFRFVAVLFLLSTNVDAFTFEQRVPRSSLLERHLQREDNESEVTDFLTEVAAVMMKDNPDTKDFSKFAMFIEALAARASSSGGPPFSSNESSANDRTREEESSFPDVGSDLTPSPKLSSMSDETDVIDQNDDSASGDLKGAIDGDATMTDGKNLAVTELPSGIVVSIIAMTTLALFLEMMN
ncbi:hypothetical protein L915_05831, partial [Phytophthora nicotianae]